jgi:hypothetical protein
MRLWRLDASFEDEEGQQAGELTRLSTIELIVANDAQALSQRGWDCDVYQETADVPREESSLLTLYDWPTLPIAELLALARSPKAAAAAQLDRIKQRTGSPNGGKPMKVFSLNDCDWWLAPDLDSAIAAAMRESGLDRDEAVNNPQELSASDLGRLVFRDNDGSKRTFAEQLERELGRDATTVRLFASTEV